MRRLHHAAHTDRHVVAESLRGHGHICLIAPDLDLEQIMCEWRGDRIIGETAANAPDRPVVAGCSHERVS
jgi:hypothetical protein